MMYYLEDLTDGLVVDLGSIGITKEDIIDFAERFDPQVFHLDEAVAGTMFGGLIASGWHTASLANRLLVDGFLNSAACMGSPGIDELSFVKPVYSEEVLTGRLTIISTRQSTKKPDRGLAKLKIEIVNTENTLVMSMIGNIFIRCRPSY